MTSQIGDALRVPIQEARRCLIASLQVELSEAVLSQFRADLLARVRAVQPIGAILEMSGIPLFDRHDFGSLRRTMDMVRLMGCPTVLVGIQPGMAAAIAETDDHCDDLRTARTLEEAFDILNRT